MAFLNLWLRIREARLLSQKLSPLAIVLTQEVRSSLSFPVLAMDRAEAHGYIRAKTTPIVHRALSALVVDHPALSASFAARAAGELTDRVARQVLDDMVRGKVQIQGVRRAA